MKNRMSFRVQVSALLISFALIAMVLPKHERSAGELRPSKLISFLDSVSPSIQVDQVARIVLEDDPKYWLIDLRSEEEFLECHLPGAKNIPAEDILDESWAGYMDDPWITAVIYSNGDQLSSGVQLLCTQSGYGSVKFMKGGLNRWFELVMESEFSGERISAAENARYELRYRARDHFRIMNSLPDSLKTAYLEVKKKEEAELVGGCE